MKLIHQTLQWIVAEGKCRQKHLQHCELGARLQSGIIQQLNVVLGDVPVRKDEPRKSKVRKTAVNFKKS